MQILRTIDTGSEKRRTGAGGVAVVSVSVEVVSVEVVSVEVVSVEVEGLCAHVPVVKWVTRYSVIWNNS